MIYDVAFTAATDEHMRRHLLQHYKKGKYQEDLCFALWRPSTGLSRVTAIVQEIILPQKGERMLHGNVGFSPDYLLRAIDTACKQGAGLAFLHSHPANGWQGMSPDDVHAEQVAIAYPAGETGYPLVGLTVGMDGYWSARFWVKEQGKKPRRHWCRKVRIVGRDQYRIQYNDSLAPRLDMGKTLERTVHSWGRECQQNIARMKIGVVGLGSVGCVVAEALARIGVSNIVLIDADEVKEHNLDRLLYGTKKNIGDRKIDVAKRALLEHATATSVNVDTHALWVQNKHAYKVALDCDFLFSCVDRHVPREILNHVANAHLIPVVDGGVAVELNSRTDRLNDAHWKAHIITPNHKCLECNGQYDPSMAAVESDGSLDNPSYIKNLPDGQKRRNQNVFAFALHVAAMEVNMMLRYLISGDWPEAFQQEYCFPDGTMRIVNEVCRSDCDFHKNALLGDTAIAVPSIGSD